MTDAHRPLTSPPAWLVVGCCVELALVALRTLGLLIGSIRVWCCAWPSYLPVTLALVDIICPVALVGLLLLWRDARPVRRPESPFGRFLKQWPLAVVPILVLALPDRAGFMGDYLLRSEEH